MNGEWQRVAALSDLHPGHPRGAKYGEADVVLVTNEGQVHALDGICPHAYALMSDGFMNGWEIECPLHAAAFDVRTGECMIGPVGCPDIATYDVKVEGGHVFVRPRAG